MSTNSSSSPRVIALCKALVTLSLGPKSSLSCIRRPAAAMLSITSEGKDASNVSEVEDICFRCLPFCTNSGFKAFSVVLILFTGASPFSTIDFCMTILLFSTALFAFSAALSLFM